MAPRNCMGSTRRSKQTCWEVMLIWGFTGILPHWLILSLYIYISINMYLLILLLKRGRYIDWYCYYIVFMLLFFHFYIAEWYLCSSYWYHQSIYLYYQQIEIAGPWDLEWWSAGARRVFPTASLLQCLITTWRLLSGKRLGNYGKSPCLRGKSSINGPFAVAMWNYRRVLWSIPELWNPFRIFH